MRHAERRKSFSYKYHCVEWRWGWKDTRSHSGTSILRPPMSPWKYGLIYQVLFKYKLKSTQNAYLDIKLTVCITKVASKWRVVS